MALPKIPWNFPAVCWLLLAVAIPASLCLECQENQYLLHGKCCSDCAPGQRMRSRCTPEADTVCSPCQDGYFSSQHHHGFCHSCTLCNARKGSVEVKPCEKTSDTVCVCQAGFMPAGIPLGNECSRCPKGTFSRGRNENCQPWTNCSFFGKSTLRAGTATEDALCLDPIPTEFPKSRAPNPTEFPKSRAPNPTKFPKSRAPIPTEFPENSSSPTDPSDPSSPTEPSWGFLSLLLLCLMLLVVSGISILLLIIQASQKKTRNGPGRSLQHKQRSCRVPVQEEHIDSSCSLIKH